jgi:molecular chaperone DnaK
MDYIQNIFLKETGIDLSEETLAIQRIKEAAEVAKLELTNRQNVTYI